MWAGKGALRLDEERRSRAGRTSQRAVARKDGRERGPKERFGQNPPLDHLNAVVAVGWIRDGR